MTRSDLTTSPFEPRRLSQPWTRLLLLALVLGLSYLSWLPFPWRQPVVAALAMALVLAAGERLSAIGFQWPLRTASTIGWALIATAIVCGLITPFIEPWLNRMTGTPADYSAYGELRGNFPAALRLVAFAWVSAAVGEEIIFRGFLLRQTDALIGTSTTSRIAGVVLGATLFGLAHAAQGLVGVLLTGLTGALMGLVFFLSDRNLWSIILAHGLIDTWGVATLYFGWY